MPLTVLPEICFSQLTAEDSGYYQFITCLSTWDYRIISIKDNSEKLGDKTVLLLPQVETLANVEYFKCIR